MKFISFLVLLLPLASFSQDEYYGAEDTIHIEFKGRVDFIDSVHREVAVLLRREGELVGQTHIDTAGKYQLDCKIVAQCHLTLHFQGEGLLEKYISFDFTSDSINRFPSLFRPVGELSIEMIPINPSFTMKSIEAAKFEWYNEFQHVHFDLAHAREQKEFLKEYSAKEER